MPSFARKCQQIFVAAVSAFHSGKAIMKDATGKEAVDHMSHIGPEKAMLLGIPLITDLFQVFKIVLDAPVVSFK